MIGSVLKCGMAIKRLAVSVCAHAGSLVAGLRARAEGRSSKWPALRKKWLALHPRCAVCGTTNEVVPHHKIPFSVDPSRELDETNLVTLCECHPINDHLNHGHLRSWSSWNPDVDKDVADWNYKIAHRPIPSRDK